jgi:hypothetical protein
MRDLRKAAEMALDYIRREGWTNPQGKEVWLALRQALAQPSDSVEQEPVGYVTDSGMSAYFLKGVDLDDDTPLYTAPPKRKWVGLTDEDKMHIHIKWVLDGQFEDRLDDTEAMLKEKNT